MAEKWERSTDPALERFARVTPPAGHVTRVRSRSGPTADGDAWRTRAARGVPWRMAMALTASASVIVAVLLSVEVPREVALPVPPATTEWTGKPLDVPVLPPQGYWAMSAIDEFERLRPSRPLSSPRGSIASPPQASANRGGPMVGPALEQLSLPPITIESIAAEPIDIADVTVPEPILLEAIPIAPIDVATLGKENK